MDGATVFVLALSFVLVLVVTWTVGEPLIFGESTEEDLRSKDLRTHFAALESEEHLEDVASGKVEEARVRSTELASSPSHSPTSRIAGSRAG